MSVTRAHLETVFDSAALDAADCADYLVETIEALLPELAGERAAALVTLAEALDELVVGFELCASADVADRCARLLDALCLDEAAPARAAEPSGGAVEINLDAGRAALPESLANLLHGAGGGGSGGGGGGGPTTGSGNTDNSLKFGNAAIEGAESAASAARYAASDATLSLVEKRRALQEAAEAEAAALALADEAAAEAAVKK
jgi:hypothetical protein